MDHGAFRVNNLLLILPTTLNSSSSSMIFDSPVSALSSALSKSASTICNFLAISSYFLSASSAKILASFNWFSKDSIRASSERLLFSRTLHILWESSAAVEAEPNFCEAMSSLKKRYYNSILSKLIIESEIQFSSLTIKITFMDAKLRKMKMLSLLNKL